MDRLGWLLVCPENKGNLRDLIRTEFIYASYFDNRFPGIWDGLRRLAKLLASVGNDWET